MKYALEEYKIVYINRIDKTNAFNCIFNGKDFENF